MTMLQMSLALKNSCGWQTAARRSLFYAFQNSDCYDETHPSIKEVSVWRLTATQK
jgi:hypothetical protein